MVGVLDRKLRRDIRSSAGLLLAIASIMTVGVMYLVAVASCYFNLSRAQSQYYAQGRMADFWIDLKKAPLSEVETIAAMPGVTAVRPRIQSFVTVDLPESPKPLNGLVLSLPDRRGPIVNDIVLEHGSYFTDRRQNEVIVNKAFAEAHRLRPGQWIYVVLNNRREELFIVGTAISCEFVYLLGPGSIIPDPEHFGVFYLKRSYAEDVFDMDGACNNVVGQLAPELRDRPRLILDRIESRLDDYGVAATIPLEEQPSNRFLSQEIEGLQTFGVVMPMIFLAVAALVLNVFLSRMADQQRTVVGTLKALGYSDREVFFHFLKLGLTVGLVGAALGCLLGYILAGMLTVVYTWYYAFPRLESHFYPGVTLLGLGVSVACAVVGSIHGTRLVLRLQPAEAMRAKPPKQGGAVLVERVGWFWRRLSSDWRMVIRDVFRARVRTAVGIFSSAMGASVLVTGFMMSDAVTFLIDFQFRYILRSDVDLVLRDERGREVLGDARHLPGVDRAEPQFNVPCTFTNGPHREKGGITGLMPGARMTVPRDLDARPVHVPPTGLAMNRTLADMLHLRRGDLVTVQPSVGHRRALAVPVTEIADSYLGTAVYADIGYLSRLMDEEFAVNSIQLAMDGDREHLARFYRELKQLPALEGVSARADLVESLETTLIQNMTVMISVLVVLAGVVFFGTIVNASLVSLAERQREVATLRVLGYGPWRVGSLLLRETLIVTVLGALLGMPLGYLLTVAAASTYDTEMFRFPVVAQPSTWVKTIVLALVFALAAHAAVQRSIHRMNWRDALQAKE